MSTNGLPPAASHLIHDGLWYLDNSALKSVAACSTQAFIRYGLGLTTPEERATLKSGACGHEAVACWFRGGTKDEALDVYANGAPCESCSGSGAEDGTVSMECERCKGTGKKDDGYQKWAEENVPPDNRLTYENTSRILSAWFDTHPSIAFPFTIQPEFVEIGFAYPLADDIVICGRMDALSTGKHDRALYVVENKFTGDISPRWLQQFKMDSQLSTYIWAAQQHTGQVVVGGFINAIEFGKLPNSDKRCKKHGVAFSECGHLHGKDELVIVTRTPEELDEWRKTALHLARRFQDLCRRYPTIESLQKVRTQGKFHGACSFCALFDFCSVGRPRHLAETMLKYEPWVPYDVTQQAEYSHTKP